MATLRNDGWKKWLPSFAGQSQNMPLGKGPSVLVVDDEPNVRLMYRSALAGLGYELSEAANGVTALTQMQAKHFDVCILDLRMPGMSGLDLMEQMLGLAIKTPVAIVTAHGQIPDAVHAMELGAIDFLPKPPTPDQLRNMVNDILLRHSAESGKFGERDFDYYLRSAKRAINLRDFPAASRYLIEALEINSGSRQAINLVGVMTEMRQEHERTK